MSKYRSLKHIRILPVSLTNNIENGTRVFLPHQRAAGTVIAVEQFRDGRPSAFFVRVDGSSRPPLRVVKGDAMPVPPGALFLAPGCDDIPPTTQVFLGRGGEA
jgi:hypothetical protein